MKLWESRFITAGLALAGIVSLIAAFKPAIKAALSGEEMPGQPLNVVFLLFGVAILIIAVALARRPVDGAGPPAA